MHPAIAIEQASDEKPFAARRTFWECGDLSPLVTVLGP
jgi:hypothetical protein